MNIVPPAEEFAPYLNDVESIEEALEVTLVSVYDALHRTRRNNVPYPRFRLGNLSGCKLLLKTVSSGSVLTIHGVG